MTTASAPGAIEPTRTATVHGRGGAGVELYTEAFLPAGEPTGVVLITHGFFEHCGRYRELAHVIVKAGWAALSYDVRGHGKSGGKRGFVDSFPHYVDDLHVALTAAKLLAPGKPAVLLGHSHGGLITLRALCGDSPPEAAHAIISSPFLGVGVKVPGWQMLLASVASRLAPGLRQAAPLAVADLTSDKTKQAERLADKACFEFVTVRWFTEALATHDYVLRHADRIGVPTTWYVGGGDKIASPTASRRVADRMTNATYHELSGQMHEVFNEVDRAKVFSQVTDVLGRVASG